MGLFTLSAPLVKLLVGKPIIYFCRLSDIKPNIGLVEAYDVSNKEITPKGKKGLSNVDAFNNLITHILVNLDKNLSTLLKLLTITILEGIASAFFTMSFTNFFTYYFSHLTNFNTNTLIYKSLRILSNFGFSLSLSSYRDQWINDLSEDMSKEFYDKYLNENILNKHALVKLKIEKNLKIDQETEKNKLS